MPPEIGIGGGVIPMRGVRLGSLGVHIAEHEYDMGIYDPRL
jgi:hypothetical protein